MRDQPLIVRVRQYRALKHEQWEGHCNRCGLCCHEKTISGSQVWYDMDSWCRFYDPETRTCTVYAQRFSKEVRCRSVNLFRAMFASYLPPTCGYVQWAVAHHLRFAPYRRIHYCSEDPDPDSPPHDARPC
ncbi:MAG: hypothetical protein K9M84_13920 [Spirochaetia bacterium]|nr:hypothetical protein [Spirochaetia bacterium]